MLKDDALLPLSALQHMIFCDRQAALIHIEGLWVDNALTVEGHHLHRIVDDLGAENRRGVLVRRGVALRSERLRLVGRADVVEFRRSENPDAGVALRDQPGWWKVIPVEYKRGKPKAHRADEVQLCAQAICLEEAFRTAINEGFLFYGQTRRRKKVRFTDALRKMTEATATDLHVMVRTGTTPIRPRKKKCERCSLLPVCLPRAASFPSARDYLEAELRGGGDGFP